MRTIIPKNAVLVPEHAARVFAGQIFSVYQWEEEMFDGTKGVFEMLKRPDTTEVLLVHDGKILVQHQEQPHLGAFYSFPGGMHDHEEESELEAAQRELREESGYSCRTWKLINVSQLHGKIEQFLYTYVATDITEKTAPALDAGERIESEWLTLNECLDLLKVQKKFRSRSVEHLKEVTVLEELLKLPEFTG